MPAERQHIAAMCGKGCSKRFIHLIRLACMSAPCLSLELVPRCAKGSWASKLVSHLCSFRLIVKARGPWLGARNLEV